MKDVTLSDADLTAYSGEHVLYELQYFYFSAREVVRMTAPSPMASVLIESFGVHLRNLIDFFCTPAGKERADDVNAADFCPGWSENLSGTLAAARERANKELSHLTLGRKDGLDPTKSWDVVGLFQEVTDIARRFVVRASPSKLNPKIADWLLKYHGGLSTIAVISGLMTSNTTATMVITSSNP